MRQVELTTYFDVPNFGVCATFWVFKAGKVARSARYRNISRYSIKRVASLAFRRGSAMPHASGNSIGWTATFPGHTRDREDAEQS